MIRNYQHGDIHVLIVSHPLHVQHYEQTITCCKYIECQKKYLVSNNKNNETVFVM